MNIVKIGAVTTEQRDAIAHLRRKTDELIEALRDQLKGVFIEQDGLLVVSDERLKYVQDRIGR